MDQRGALVSVFNICGAAQISDQDLTKDITVNEICQLSQLSHELFSS